ncbi:DUF1963 domain-containing protein [Bacillus sp. FJAT-42376]|uniref:YwqG family protein n=1 Tax=Bacillus sp. FJAT-42376 TaxID=2014076 RepID=UPI000F4F36ED|nr:YwqG family protein [Bacillus sp. FJAT-42376]AZB41957.1 DUF1963 domain-containing protein [Bacillus sp. FJAT-42376]
MLTLPKELEKYRNQLEKYMVPFVSITAKKGRAELFQSKFGGFPYLPKNVEHPKDEKGLPMKLLAQINFSEVPPLEDFPERGILQIFLSASDDVYGLDFDNPVSQKNFRILYHEEILAAEQIVTDFSYHHHSEDEDFPLEGEAVLSFEKSAETISSSDFRFEQVDVDTDEVTEEGTDIEELMWEALSGQGHKLGGYPFFTQYDPRDGDKTFKNHLITLIQIDTDDHIDLMWGDAGVANFFITKEDLLNKNFTNVLYNWDCH